MSGRAQLETLQYFTYNVSPYRDARWDILADSSLSFASFLVPTLQLLLLVPSCL